MRIAAVFPILAVASTLALGAEPAPAAQPSIAKVDGRAISVSEFDQALVAAVRQRFYHRAPPEGEMAAVRREVADSLIELALVSTEARRLSLVADAAKIDRDIERIEARFRNLPGWDQHRAAQVARWRADLEERALAEMLEKRVREAVSPEAGAVRRFYHDNPVLFTEPEKVRVGLILLNVDPSAGKAARDRAREEAVAIRGRLAKGADFGELAKMHSGDESASKAGDLGFVHRGALPEPVQAIADKLDGGAISDPIDVLEGIAIIRVTDRKEAQLRPFEAVEERARELLRRKAADEAWKAHVEKLRALARIEIDPRRFPEIATAPEAGRTSPPSPQ